MARFLPHPVPVLRSFSNGMKRDFARDRMPPNTLWNSVDMVSDILGAPIRKRGGYTYEGAATSSITASSDHIVAGLFAPFKYRSVATNVAFDEDGFAFIIGASSAASIGLTQPTLQPVFYSDKILVPASDGTSAPKQIVSDTAGVLSVTSMSASAPPGRYGIIFKDVFWLAGSSASAQRIFFAVEGDPTSWDQVNKFADVSLPITGLAGLSNAVLVFSLDRAARFRGTTPPPGGDFVLDDPVFDVGCTDSRSITNYQDKVVWGNASGLFISDGAAMDDLTALCGMKNWWLSVMAGNDGFSTGSAYDISTWSIVTDVYRNYLIYSVMAGTSYIDGGFIDLKRYVWGRFSNLKSAAMWGREFPEEMFLGSRVSSRIKRASSLFSPTAATSADGDGTVVAPYIETPYFPGAGALQTFKFIFLEYDLRDPGSANPYLTFSYITSPESTSYTALADTAAETTAVDRVHRSMGVPGRGIALKIAQTNASSDTRLYQLEIAANTQDAFK